MPPEQDRSQTTPTPPPNAPLLQPQVPTASYGVLDANQQPKPLGRRHKTLIIAGTVLTIGVIITISLLVFAKNGSEGLPAKGTERASAGPTAFEKKLNDEQKEILRSIKYSAYVPASQPITGATLSYYKDAPEKMFVAYGVNPQFGKGHQPGSYSYMMWPKTNSFNPPNNCMPSWIGATPCAEYKGGSKDTPAYTHNGSVGPAITYVAPDGTSPKPITLFVIKDDMVIAITTADTDPSVLYSLAQNMKKIPVKDLPESTTIGFY
jgi:hypothetical protein